MSMLLVTTDSRRRVSLVHTSDVHDAARRISRRAAGPRATAGSRTARWSRPRLGWEAASHDLSSLLSVSDTLVTSGWSALQALENNDALSDLHVVTDFHAHLVAGRVGKRPLPRGTAQEIHKKALINRARRILVLSTEDLRAIRAWGRSPILLDRGVGSPHRVGGMRVDQLATWLDVIVPGPHYEESFTTTMRRAVGSSLPDLDALMAVCTRGQGPFRVQTLNLQHLYMAQKSAIFREAVATASAVTADGWPAVQLLNSGGGDLERTTGSDFLKELLVRPEIGELRLGLIGDTAEVGDAFRRMVDRQGGHLLVREHGDKRDWDPRELAARLQEADVQLTLVAVTQPAGDLLGQELLGAGYTGVVIGIGASVEFVVGARRRAPVWMQRIGLEWFFRFLLEPKRMFRRYFIEGIPTYAKVIWPMTTARVLE